MEFIRGARLSSLPSEEIMRLVDAGQNAFLVQLLDIGFIHSDPHPGNLLKVRPSGVRPHKVSSSRHMSSCQLKGSDSFSFILGSASALWSRAA